MKPFLKWVGGKTQHLEDILPLIDKGEIYYELFLGGGAVMIELLKRNAFEKMYANDINPQLINTYIQIQTNVEKLVEYLKAIESQYNSATNPETFYYTIRTEYNRYSSLDPLQASYFIFLNKVGFRGLYRVNRDGKFNVPFGHYKSPTLYEEENFRQLHQAFQRVVFSCGSFDALSIEKNAVVYLDPPYVPEAKNSFTAYSPDSFDHQGFFKYCQNLTNLRIRWIMSNSFSGQTRELLDTRNYRVIELRSKRRINSKTPQSTTQEVLVSWAP